MQARPPSGNALRNYLLRLGWSYKDKEIFDLEESIKYFNLEGIGKSPSKLDISRIYSMNEYYIKNIDENDLFNFLLTYCETFQEKIPDLAQKKIKNSLHFLKNKAKTLEDIWENAQYIIKEKIVINTEDIKLIDDLSKKIIRDFITEYEKISSLTRETLEPVIKSLIEKHKTNFKGVGQPLRIALVGSKFGPGLYDVILSLNKTTVINRLKKLT